MAKTQRGILTIPEVASYLSISERTVYRLVGDGKIPAFKVGGAWRFSKSNINTWIKKQTKARSGSA